eukprot:CAMPEP_0175741324 /NCGR_PEP_ID=MMETSP0097-20121207/55964_1 /TAXON_ID=311494 /ORGANISM="Alexandrium monilatum, Strain CCMP3105" /LENGTH=76 /DNA_ID=CAMNT_0017049621 /DNA_START=13 /DNA_END=240 /DNA_ORIENTATION=+
MASPRSPGRLLLIASAASLCLLLLRSVAFVPSPEAVPAPATAAPHFSPAVAASAALPVLTMLAEDAEAKYGDSRRW